LALLNFVFDLAHEQAERVGCVAIVVDAKDAAQPFYESLGFIPLAIQSGGLGDRPVSTPMFIWLQDVPKRG
jgi:hypothetical protein